MRFLKESVPFHPPLFALHPALALFGANVAILSFSDVWPTTAAVIAASLALWGILWLALRDSRRAAAAASVFLLATFSYSAISLAGRRSGVLRDSDFPLWLWGILTLGAIWVVARKHRAVLPMTNFFNFVGVVIVAFAALNAGKGAAVVKKEMERAAYNPDKIVPISQGRKRDVFYILLDGYGRTDTFERIFDFSNQEFIKDLEKRGFYVARNAHSNYAQTELSLASALNMSPIQELAKPSGDTARDRSRLDALIDHNRLSRELRKDGYQFFAITTGFPSLLFKSADVRLVKGDGSAMFTTALLAKTPFPLGALLSGAQFETRREYVKGGFRALESLAGPRATPKFVYAHILAPHPPFVFDANGLAKNPKMPFGLFDANHFNDEGGSDEDYIEGYRGQAQYVAKEVLHVLDTLLSAPGADPIIVIHGDHGPKSHVNQDKIEETDLNELFGILMAVRAPEEIRKQLAEDLTPVNVFREILTLGYERDLPPLPNKSYYSAWETPLDFTEVTDRLTLPPAPAGEAPNVDLGLPRDVSSAPK